MSPEIAPLLAADWVDVARIYEEGLATGDASFETSAPTWDSWDEHHLADCRLVARIDGDIVGWAALSSVSDRCVYGGVAEIGIYVAAAARGRGVGRTLLEALIAASEEIGLWTLQAGVFPENTASVALHHACGFRTVGKRERLGKLNDRWRDVLLLERRSPKVGL